MSRGQESQTFDTAKGQSGTYFNNAQNSYATTQSDIGDFSKQLSKYAADNPYSKGGAFNVASNRITANNADAGAQRAGEMLQSQAGRTGQNTAGAVSATEKMQQENTRDLTGEQAAAEKERIGAGAQYAKSVLDATAQPAEMEAKLSQDQASAAAGALGTQQKAGETPSWTDQFGSAFAQNLGKGSADLLTGGL